MFGNGAVIGMEKTIMIMHHPVIPPAPPRALAAWNVVAVGATVPAIVGLPIGTSAVPVTPTIPTPSALPIVHVKQPSLAEPVGHYGDADGAERQRARNNGLLVELGTIEN